MFVADVLLPPDDVPGVDGGVIDGGVVGGVVVGTGVEGADVGLEAGTGFFVGATE
jgi:hypothetical protein